MIYFNSFFNEKSNRGEVLSISNSEPPKFRGKVRSLYFLAPEWSAVERWQKSAKQDADWLRFVRAYRETCQFRWSLIKLWLESLKPEEDVTLCCWEKSPERCHRSLVAKLVLLHRPDCFGGEIVAQEKSLATHIV